MDSSSRHDEWVRVERTPAFQEFARKRKVFLIDAQAVMPSVSAMMMIKKTIAVA